MAQGRIIKFKHAVRLKKLTLKMLNAKELGAIRIAGKEFLTPSY